MARPYPCVITVKWKHAHANALRLALPPPLVLQYVVKPDRCVIAIISLTMSLWPHYAMWRISMIYYLWISMGAILQ